MFGFGLVEKAASAPESWGYTHQKTNSVEVEESGKGGLGRGGGEEEEEGDEGGKLYRNQKRKRKLKTNLMDITEPEFPAEVQNMRALEWVYVELEPKLN